MKTVEKYALDAIAKELRDAMDRCSDKNHERMQHERIFIQGNLERAMKALMSIEDNNPEMYKR